MVPPIESLSAQGYDLQFATHVLGAFRLCDGNAHFPGFLLTLACRAFLPYQAFDTHIGEYRQERPLE